MIDFAPGAGEPEFAPPPETGWKIGTTLVVCIGAVLLIVLGGLSAVQLRREAHREVIARQALLAQSLAPLATDIEHATAVDEIRERLETFHSAFETRNHPGLHLVLRDRLGAVVASTTTEPEAGFPTALETTIPVGIPAIGEEQGSLTAWQDDSRMAAEIAERRRLTWLDIFATLVALAVGVQIAVYVAVSRPLRALLILIEKTENGYVQNRALPGGAAEIRWLAWRFQRMSAELVQGARLFVAAQRRAMELTQARRDTPTAKRPAGPSIENQENRAATDTILHRYLLDRCVFLESRQAGDAFARDDAEEAWDSLVVEAERIGDMQLKSRLENAALNILEPGSYETVNRSLEALLESRADWINDVKAAFAASLNADKCAFIAIQHRVKHVAGVWRKMQERHLDINEVHDIIAFRIIVPDRDDCYLALDSIHRLYEPELFRFKDYVAKPKRNGYMSLHTTVRDQRGMRFEVQIRSLEMHEAAENGGAAHWRYRSGKAITPRTRWRARVHRE